MSYVQRQREEALLAATRENTALLKKMQEAQGPPNYTQAALAPGLRRRRHRMILLRKSPKP